MAPVPTIYYPFLQSPEQSMGLVVRTNLPTPEPGSLVLMLLGLGCLAFFAVRKYPAGVDLVRRIGR